MTVLARATAVRCKRSNNVSHPRRSAHTRAIRMLRSAAYLITACATCFVGWSTRQRCSPAPTALRSVLGQPRSTEVEFDADRRHCAMRCRCCWVQPGSTSETAPLPRAARSFLHRLLEQLQFLLDAVRGGPPVFAEEIPLRDLSDSRVGLDVDDFDRSVPSAQRLDLGIREHLADQGGRLVTLLSAPVSSGTVCHLEAEACGHAGVCRRVRLFGRIRSGRAQVRQKRCHR